MANLTADFEVSGAVDAQAIATTDAGSADAWDTVSIGASAFVEYDTALAWDGTRSARIGTGASSTTANLRWSTKFTSKTDHYGIAIFYIGAGWNAAIDVIRLLNASAQVCAFNINATKHLVIKDSAGTIQATAGTAIAGGSFCMVAWHVVHSATVGSVVLDFYTDPLDAAPAYSITATNINTGTACNEMRFGINSSVINGGPINFDHFIVHSDTAVAPITVAPTNTGAPVISGTPADTSTLTDTNADTWTGSPSSYQRQWQRANDAAFTSGVGDIGGETGTTYVLAAADRNKYVRLKKIAHNVAGDSAPAYSNVKGPVGTIVSLPSVRFGEWQADWVVEDAVSVLQPSIAESLEPELVSSVLI